MPYKCNILGWSYIGIFEKFCLSGLDSNVTLDYDFLVYRLSCISGQSSLTDMRFFKIVFHHLAQFSQGVVMT